MNSAVLSITINGDSYKVERGATIISAAAANGIYIPALCHHPDLPPISTLTLVSHVFRGRTRYDNQPPDDEPGRVQGCGLCLVEVAGHPEPLPACETQVTDGMSIRTESEALREVRSANLMKILARHPHACLTCAQREGCSLEDCSSNVPKEERCCHKFHNCELRKLADYVGIRQETPRYRPAALPILQDEPLFCRDFNLCIDCGRCVRMCNQVRGVEALGVVHRDGRLIVGSVAPTLSESDCRFCGACVEVCPTGCLTDKGLPAGDRERWLVPCVHTCPAGVDVPGYVRRIAEGDLKGAAALVYETLPLPNVLAHICFHLCENECRRGQINEPIAICALKRFALAGGDGALLEKVARSPETGRKVAVVGAGPAGLTAAYFLRFKGHAVTIFEAAQSPGGMPALAIPTYRLPSGVLEKDIAVIRRLGVEIQTGRHLATGQAMLDLLDQGFDALLIAIGLPNSKRIPIPGSDLEGVCWGLEFLTAVKAGKSFELGRKVAVVGGGNVAIDVAMTALRLSGAAVRLFCLESRDEMPAHAFEIDKAEAEGIEINPGWGPAAILGDRGRVSGVEFRRCVAVFDGGGNFAPKFDDRQRMTMEADAVILAIGQAPPEGIPAQRDGVFMAGDLTGGPLSAIHAVASGRAAAQEIDRFLGGDGNVSVRLTDRSPPGSWIGRQQGFPARTRVPVPCPAPEVRCTDFRQIEGNYTLEQAVAEAKRCLQCDLRLMITPAPLPPEPWLEFNRSNVDKVPAVEGVFVLAGAEKKPTVVKGTGDLREDLLAKLESGTEARFFRWEVDRMYTKRESELIQQHLNQYGELPGGGDEELDDLF